MAFYSNLILRILKRSYPAEPAIAFGKGGQTINDDDAHPAHARAHAPTLPMSHSAPR